MNHYAPQSTLVGPHANVKVQLTGRTDVGKSKHGGRQSNPSRIKQGANKQLSRAACMHFCFPSCAEDDDEGRRLASRAQSSLIRLTQGSAVRERTITQWCATRLTPCVRTRCIGGGEERGGFLREAHGANVKLPQHNISRNPAK